MTFQCQFGDCDFDLNCSIVSCDRVNNDTFVTWMLSEGNDTCHSLDLGTCRDTFWNHVTPTCNASFRYEYDEDGCHNMGEARKSCFYKDYLAVKYVLGIIGIGEFMNI